jgi:hypothetical protein
MAGGRANRTGVLEKGYLENVKTGQVLRFQYNPEQFNDDIGVEYREIKSPGISYPIYQYVGGETRSIEFTLFLDNMENQGGTNKIRETINYLNTFLPPANMAVRYYPPPEVIFGFGWFVKRCILVAMPTRYTMFDRKLQPLRAEVDVRLNIIQ